MGAKAWFAAYYDEDPKVTLGKQPRLDRGGARRIAEHFFPDAKISEKEDSSLAYLNPGRRVLMAGDYGSLKIVAHRDLSGDYPSRITPRWTDTDLGKSTYIHATHSVVDWYAFGFWQDGRLQRALSVSTESGVIEETGRKLAFEDPFWQGSHPIEDKDIPDTPALPFHPLDLSEAALLATFGFQFEGCMEEWICDPAEIPIMTFEISNGAWWKFW